MEAATVVPDLQVEGPDIDEVLSPLLARRDQLLAKERELEGLKQEVRGERQRIEKGLRAFEVIEKTKRKTKPSNGHFPRNRKAQENLEEIEAVIPSFDGNDFQIKTVEDATGISRSGIETVLKHLHQNGKIRLMGMQPQLGRTIPGGRKAITYREVK